ncbi:MAG: prepilin-type N-terminal cleavage/methylation domain-containing protein [bacterium]|nr:prepilin-type N-terminal cleavage/methylation domain-containing protein [bacterium]
MRTRATLNRTKGYTLIEMLASIAVMAVFINICLVIFVMATRLSLLGTTTLTSMQAVETVQRDFTETVRSAVSVEQEAGTYRTGPDTLVLRLPALAGQDARYAVFGMLGDDSRLSRYVLVEKDDALAADRFFTYPVDIEGLAFDYGEAPPGKARSVTMTVTIKKDTQRRTPSMGNTFTAALGGNAP